MLSEYTLLEVVSEAELETLEAEETEAETPDSFNRLSKISYIFCTPFTNLKILRKCY
jgi:hypothetical protein